MADKKISALTAATTPLAGTEVLPIVQSGSTVKVSISDVTAGRVVGASSVAVSSLSSPYVRVDNGALGTLNVASLELWTTNNFSGRSKTFIRNECQNAGNSNADLVFGVNSTGGGAEYEAARLKGVGGDLQLAIGNLVLSTAGKGIDFSANTHAAGMTSELLTWYEEGTFTATRSGFTEVGTVTSPGTYTRIGRLVFVNVQIVPTGGGTTAATSGIGSYLGGLPFTPTQRSSGVWVNTGSVAASGSVWVNTDGNLYLTEGWGTSGSVFTFSAIYTV